MEKISSKFKLKKLSLREFFTFSIAPAKQFIVASSVIGVLFLVSACVHWYLFSRVSERTLFQVDPTVVAQTKGVNEKKLAAVIALFAEKAKVQTEVLTKTPPVLDPEK